MKTYKISKPQFFEIMQSKKKSNKKMINKSYLKIICSDGTFASIPISKVIAERMIGK